MIFENREDAGRRLAEYLKQRNLEADIVLAVPPGGLPIGKKVANELNLPLDVIVSRTICAPGDPGKTIGAVTSNGEKWVDRELIQQLDTGDDYIHRKVEEQIEKSRKDTRFLRGNENLPEVEGKKVILVKDGIITGASAIACAKQLKSIGAEKVTIAVPVGPQRNYKSVRSEADDVIIMETPRFFGPVSSFYENFEDINNEEARSYIAQQALD